MYRVSDTLHLKEHHNFLISMTYQHQERNHTLRLAWNDMAFSYFPSTHKVEISKTDLSQFNEKYISLPVYARYPNNLMYRSDDFPALNYPITFNLLKKDAMMYFYLNEHPIHVMEFDDEHDTSLKRLQDNHQQHVILSEASQEANAMKLEVYSF